MKVFRELHQTRKNLLILCRGPGAIEPPVVEPNRNWDLLEIYWDAGEIAELESAADGKLVDPPRISEADGVVFETDPKKHKFHIVKEWVNAQGGGLIGYEAIALTDDDIDPVDTWSGIFTAFTEFRFVSGCRVAQPALTRESFYAHEITRQELGTSGPRETTFVEVMCPIFTANKLYDYLECFDEDVSTWGFEALWSAGELRKGRWLAILDNAPVRHVRKIGQGHAYAGKQGLEEARESFCNTHYLMRPEQRVVSRTLKRFDAIFYDEVGGPFSGDGHGAGGSEWATIKLAAELARCGLKILCLTNGGPAAIHDGVQYGPLQAAPDFECEALVIQRYSHLPHRGGYGRSYLALHDVWGAYMNEHVPLLEAGEMTALAISDWQRSGMPPTIRDRAITVPPIMPKLPLMDPKKKIRGRFVYHTAAMKGLEATLAFWSVLARPGQTLRAVLPPYGDVPLDIPEGVEIIRGGNLLEELALAEGVFYVNTFEECMPLALTMAEALGCRMHILGLCPNGLAGITEAVSSRLPTTDSVEFETRFANGSNKDLTPAKVFTAEAAGDTWMRALGFRID